MANKLLDFLQGASNAAASNISAPVDGVAWLLRKAGLDIKNPVMGSDWMAQRGLTREPENRLAGILGESLGGVAPMLAAAKAPQIARGLLQGADNLAAPRTMNPQTGAVVWHGSPHKFDKFDSAKIGTGEGAQAYGHGLYLADNQAVAGEYAKNIMGPKATPENIALKVMNAGNDPVQRLKQIFPKMTDAEVNGAIQSAKGYQGNTYKVDLPDEHIAKMLDWDKPLSAQHPDVQAAAQSLMKNGTQNQLGWLSNADSPGGLAMTGKQFLNSLQGSEAQMQKAGIPGIRYLDGGSRATGGTSNYVVFPGNEGLLSIMERNGQPVNALKSMMAR